MLTSDQRENNSLVLKIIIKVSQLRSKLCFFTRDSFLRHSYSLGPLSFNIAVVRLGYNNNNNTLFVQYHEQEIPEVIPIEGIPFVNQSKSNQLNLTRHKSNQIKFCFLRRGENRSTRRKNLSEQSRETINLSPHMTPSPGIEPGPHWWEASALDTAPTLLPHILTYYLYRGFPQFVCKNHCCLVNFTGST